MNTQPGGLLSQILLALLGPHLDTPAIGMGDGEEGLGRVPGDETVDQSSGGP